VSCATNTYSVGGTVSGLTGSALVLQNNGGDDLSIGASGNFTFSNAVASGAAYAVTVKMQPTGLPLQVCKVASGAATMASAAVTNINVTCGSAVGKFVYVANAGSDNVSGYSIDSSTGSLSPLPNSPFAADQMPVLLSASRAGTFLYSANQGSSTVPPTLSGYSINGVSGALSPLTSSPFGLSPPPALPAPAIGKPILHPSGAFGYVGFPIPQGQLFGATADSSGNLTPIPGMPITVGVGLTFGIFNAAGNVLYIAHNGGGAGTLVAYSVSSPSGVLASIGSYATGGQSPSGIALNRAGTLLFVTNLMSGTVSVFNVNPTTGTLTSVGSPVPTGTGTQAAGVTVHPTKNFVHVANYGVSSSVSGFQFDATTGALTPLAGSPYSTHGGGGVVPNIDPTGTFVFVVNGGSDSIQAFTIDQTTGVLADVQGTPFATGGASPTLAWMDVSGKYLYSSNTGSNTVSAYAINVATGAVVLIDTVPAGMSPRFPEAVGFQ
jgi:6-phosphogluconolactonase